MMMMMMMMMMTLMGVMTMMMIMMRMMMMMMLMTIRKASDQVKFANISVGGRECRTVHDPVTGRYRCHFGAEPRAGLFVTEVTGESEEDMQCHCSILHNSISLSTSSRIQLRFLVEGMRPDQDFNDFSMRGSFRFVNTLCTDSTLTRGGGRVTLDQHSSQRALCDRSAWGISLPPHLALHLRLPGLLLSSGSASCPSRARLVIRLASEISIICPDGPGTVSLSSNASNSGPSPLLTASVHLTGGSSPPLSFNWLQLSPIPLQPALVTDLTSEDSNECMTPCPALGGCLPPALWCDGAQDCL